MGNSLWPLAKSSLTLAAGLPRLGDFVRVGYLPCLSKVFLTLIVYYFNLFLLQTLCIRKVYVLVALECAVVCV